MIKIAPSFWNVECYYCGKWKDNCVSIHGNNMWVHALQCEECLIYNIKIYFINHPIKPIKIIDDLACSVCGNQSTSFIMEQPICGNCALLLSEQVADYLECKDWVS